MGVAEPEFFRIDDGGHGCLELGGEETLEATVNTIDAILFCRETGVRCLLVDIKEVTGFPSPTIAARFEFISRWAATSEGKVLISIVARPEMILDDKFGVLIAANRGMVSDVFPDAREATQWLKDACKRFS
ncbi:MAG TPA: hypothetical protein VGI80_04930 [Pyrinomonadaceae bacterium]|jgi:hypothetical protein